MAPMVDSEKSYRRLILLAIFVSILIAGISIAGILGLFLASQKPTVQVIAISTGSGTQAPTVMMGTETTAGPPDGTRGIDRRD